MSTNANSLAVLNAADPNKLPDNLRVMNQSAFGQTSAVAIGDLLNKIIAKVNQAAASGAASQTITLAGTWVAGGTMTLTTPAGSVAYTTVAGDANLNGAAASLAAALNANAAFAARYKATAASAVVTVAALRKGTGANSDSFVLATANMGTLTATAGGATLVGGTGLDDLLSIV